MVPQFKPGALFGGALEQAYRAATVNTFGGGVNEVQRDIIAMAGLLLPRKSMYERVTMLIGGVTFANKIGTIGLLTAFAY